MPIAIPSYRSGAAAKLAGIPVETLRVWERRYKVVDPGQSTSGQRLYSTENIARLTLIKQLVDAGVAIGSIAALGVEQLRAMRNQAGFTSGSKNTQGEFRAQDTMSVVRMAIVGDALALRVERQRIPGLQVIAASPDAAHALQTLKAMSADALLIEVPTLQRETTETIRLLAQQVGARRVIVEYGFGPQRVEKELRELGYNLARAPMDLTQLESLCGVLPGDHQGGVIAPLPRTGAAAPRRFDARALAEISMTAVALNCECPHHLADLLVRLGNFETFSGECAHRSPADAELHNYLQRITGNARVMLEGALARVAQAEGIALPF